MLGPFPGFLGPRFPQTGGKLYVPHLWTAKEFPAPAIWIATIPCQSSQLLLAITTCSIPPGPPSNCADLNKTRAPQAFKTLKRVSAWLALPPKAGTSLGVRGGTATMMSSSPSLKSSTAHHPSRSRPSCGQQEVPSRNGRSCLCNLW